MIYIFLVNDSPHRPPSNFFRKNPEKIPGKGHPRARILVEFKEKFPDHFLQYANNVGTPLFRSMRQAQNTDTCLLYTSDAADDGTGVDLGGRRIIKKNFFF